MKNTSLLLNQAEQIVSRFPSRPALAEAMGHRNQTTVQSWINAGYIRPKHYPVLLDAARSLGVTLRADDFALVDAKALAGFFQSNAANAA